MIENLFVFFFFKHRKRKNRSPTLNLFDRHILDDTILLSLVVCKDKARKMMMMTILLSEEILGQSFEIFTFSYFPPPFYLSSLKTTTVNKNLIYKHCSKIHPFISHNLLKIDIFWVSHLVYKNE